VEPTIRYRKTGSSDTLSSGAGPDTAITGTNVAHTNGSASTTIELTNNPLNLLFVNSDGSHAIWLDTASGRKLSKIVGVDDLNYTVTVEDKFTINSKSPVSYAIGGYRQNLDADSAQPDYDDYKEGWTVQLGEGNYDLSETWTLPLSSQNGPGFTIKAEAGYSVKPKIRQTSTSATFPMIVLGNVSQIYNITFENSSTAKSATNNILRNNAQVRKIVVTNCDFISSRSSSTNGGYGYYNNHSVGASGIFERCYFEGGVYGIYWFGGRCNIVIMNCRFHDNHYGLRTSVAGNNGSLMLLNTIFDQNAAYGLWGGVQLSYSHLIKNCTFYDNGTGIFIQGNNQNAMQFTHCIFQENGYGYRNSGTGGVCYPYENYNVYYLNTTADNNDVTTIQGDTVLTGTDPLLVDPSNGDFAVGAGSPCIDIDTYGTTAGAIACDPGLTAYTF